MPPIKKILVVGASIAGPAVCFWLKKFGFSPTLIEKHPNLRHGGYAIDVRGIATDVVKKMGIYEQICAMRTRLESGRYVDANGKILFEEQGEKFGFRQGEEVEIVRGDIVNILMQTIPDIPCHFNQAIQSIQQHDDHVEVNFKDGKTEYYDLVIGTDGLHSSVRRMVFSEDEYSLVDLGSYISIFSAPNFLNLKHCEVLFEADEKLATLTSDKNPDIAQAGFMFRSEHRLQDIRDEKEQKQFLRDTFQNLGWETNTLLAFMEKTEDFYFDSITQVKMKSWTKGRVALLGDAGFCASPLSGQGTSLALVGAYVLAGELHAANGDFPLAFKRYNERLHAFVAANQSFGAWVSETFLVRGETSKEMAEERANQVLQKMQTVTSAITLPDYASSHPPQA